MSRGACLDEAVEGSKAGQGGRESDQDNMETESMLVQHSILRIRWDHFPGIQPEVRSEVNTGFGSKPNILAKKLRGNVRTA